MRTMRHGDNACEVGKRSVPYFHAAGRKAEKSWSKTPKNSLKKLTGYQMWYLHYYF